MSVLTRFKITCTKDTTAKVGCHFHFVLDCDILIAKAAVPGVRLSTGLGRLRGLQGQGGGPTELQVCTHTVHCTAVVVCSVTVSEFSGNRLS